MITTDDYLNFWKKHYSHVKVPDDELTQELVSNADNTVAAVTLLLDAFGEERDLTSGWRPVEVNKTVPGAALRSNHTRCLAADISDPDGDLDDWCTAHPDTLAKIGLWQEHPASTKGWCHVQIVAPKSGKRVFYP